MMQKRVLTGTIRRMARCKVQSLFSGLNGSKRGFSGNGMGLAAVSDKIRNKLHINGKWVDAQSGKQAPCTSPFSGETVTMVAEGDAKDVDLAFQAAHNTVWGPSPTWGRDGPGGKERAKLVHKMAQNLRDQKEIWATIETLDCGKPINESRADVDACADTIDFYADMAEELETTTGNKAVDPRDRDFRMNLRREPIGVVGMVTPWNFPLLQGVAKVAPALAAGCSMVLKPSSMAPLTCLKIAELAQEAGIPDGVVNVINGPGSAVGGAISSHPMADRLSYTGSGAVGEGFMRDGSKHLVQVSLELGGKGAIVVFDDAPLEATVDWIMCGIFICAGQVCSATSRLIVQEGVKPKLMEMLVDKATKIARGDPMLDSTLLGPMCSLDQQGKVLKMIEQSVAGGAKLLCGGGVPAEYKGTKAAFVEPTILDDVPLDNLGWVDEIFGPVLSVRSFSTEQEALQLANGTNFGLANAVFTADNTRLERVASRLHAGVVWKNCSQPIPCSMPFGGFKKSGFGKEFGGEGLDEYLQTKSMLECDSGYSWKWYG